LYILFDFSGLFKPVWINVIINLLEYFGIFWLIRTLSIIIWFYVFPWNLPFLSPWCFVLWCAFLFNYKFIIYFLFVVIIFIWFVSYFF
jgi:hypothetical protein